MRTKGVWFRDITVCVLLLITGIVLGSLVKDWPLLTLKKDVDLIGALSSLIIIGATLYVAYFVAASIERQKENNRVEKDLVIRRIDDVYDLIEEFSIKLASQNLPVTLINSYLKRIPVNLFRITDVVETSTIAVENSHKDSMTASIKRLKDLLTDTPADGKSSENSVLPLSVVNDTVFITDDRKIEVDKELDHIKGLIFKFELAINKG